uniref:Uncharacterized protein n=1 Tax=Aegilops tauschii subsp. strangulata TaxID=200361 RepID=A0A453AIE1_AEGTS
MTATTSTVLNFLSERLCKVAGSQMAGVHVIGEKRDSTSQTMISPAQLKPELRTKLVRIFLASAITVQDERGVGPRSD